MTVNSSRLPDWVHRLYAAQQTDVDKGIDILFRNVDNMLLANEFEDVDNLLQQLELERLCLSLIVAVLSITAAARSRLPYRADFVRRARAQVEQRAPDRVEPLLQGLE